MSDSPKRKSHRSKNALIHGAYAKAVLFSWKIVKNSKNSMCRCKSISRAARCRKRLWWILPTRFGRNGVQ